MALKILRSGSVLGKSLAIGLIVLVLMIPLSMLRELVSERTSMRDQAYATVAEGWGGDLTTSGPMLVVPVDLPERNEKGERILVRRQLYVLPDTLTIQVDIAPQPERLRVGIYEVPVYLARTKMSGEFAADALFLAATKRGAESNVHFDRARLRLPLSETRSLRELVVGKLNSESLNFAPALPGIYPGIEAELNLSDGHTGPLKFDFELVLAGSRNFSIMPLGAKTQVSIASVWPDPKFIGPFLPAARRIDSHGFEANWQVLELNRNFGQAWFESELQQNSLINASFGVRLFQSVDVYQSSERAVKYALLFIALTFLSFFAWEQISKVAVHPMQYLFIGLALSVFYLLLIALTEHIRFAAAYWTSAWALVALLGVYTGSVLRGAKRGIAVAAAMTLTYAILYMLVLSEEYALLMGALTLFIILAVVMLSTRRVEWYRPTQDGHGVEPNTFDSAAD